MGLVTAQVVPPAGKAALRLVGNAKGANMNGA